MNEPWLRPKTNKLYLHPPLAERICLMCPDFKLLSLSLLDNGTHVGQPGVGIIFLHGKYNRFFDMEKTSFRAVTPSEPLYQMENNEEYNVKIEAFCDFERNPCIFFKADITNTTESILSDSFGIMPRSGQEKYMLNQHQESYSPYCPNGKNWFMLKRTWHHDDIYGKASSDMGSLLIKAESSCNISWQKESFNGHAFEASDFFKIDFILNPKESITVFGCLKAEGDICDFDYDKERLTAQQNWKKIRDSIKICPDTNDEKYLSAYYHLAIQCMQMLARYKGSDLVTARQGDVGRFIWPYEGAQVISMLDRIGLDSNTLDALDC